MRLLPNLQLTRSVAMLCIINLVVSAYLQAKDQGRSVAIASDQNKIQATVDSNLLFTYWLKKPKDSTCTSPSASYFHPLSTPSGLVLTDLAPDDHLHHRGVFLAWLEVRNKVGEGDFWGWGKYAKQEDRVLQPLARVNTQSEGETIRFTLEQDWMAGNKALIKETFGAQVEVNKQAHVYHLKYQFSSEHATELGQHAFSGFTFRSRKDATIQAYSPNGLVDLPPPHHLKPESNWPDQPWYAFELTFADGRKAGFGIINSPTNPKTTWHNVIKIGLMNPCIIAPSTVKFGGDQKLILTYKVVTFDGPVPTQLLNQLAGID